MEYVLPKSAPVYDSGKLYMGTDSGRFYCIDAKTGTEIWHFLVPFGAHTKLIFSTPVIHGDTVLFGAYDGNLYALNKHTGVRVWVNFDADWIGSSPAVSLKYNLVFVGVEFGFWKKRGGIQAVSIQTGRKVWGQQSSEYTHGSPTCSDTHSMVVCGSNDGIVYGLDAQTGVARWEFNSGGEVKGQCVLSPDNTYIAYGSFNNHFGVLDTATGTPVVKIPTLFGNYSDPLWIDSNTVVCASLDKRIRAWSVSKNTLLWEYAASARIFATPVLCNDKIYCGGNNAGLHVLDAHTGKLVEYYQATERITNRVAIDTKSETIYLPTFANELIALRK